MELIKPPSQVLQSIHKEAKELTEIFTATGKTAKNKIRN